MGKVTDVVTKQPLPFANVYLKGNTIGVTTGFDGSYSLESRLRTDTLLVSYIGYHSGAKHLVLNKFQTIDFELFPSNLELSEVVITPGENPAEVILRRIINNKPENNREKLDGL